MKLNVAIFYVAILRVTNDWPYKMQFLTLEHNNSTFSEKNVRLATCLSQMFGHVEQHNTLLQLEGLNQSINQYVLY